MKTQERHQHCWAALVSNGEMADANFELIEAAKKEIYLVEFLMRDDEFGLMKLAVLRKKCRLGIKVHLHVDAFHLLVNPALVKHLMDEGIDLTVFNQFSFARLNRVTARNHCKILIVDNCWLKMGDSNTGNEYVHWGSGHQMKSMDVIIQGKLASEVRRFANSLIHSSLSKTPEIEISAKAEAETQRQQIENLKQIAKTCFELLQIQMDAPDQFTRPQNVFITAPELQAAINLLDQAETSYEVRRQQQKRPHENPWQKRPLLNADMRFHADPVDKSEGDVGVAKAIRHFIEKATSELVIVTPYLLLTDDMRAILKAALVRNVKIQIYTNSLQSTDNTTTQMAYEYRLDEVAALGASGKHCALQVFEFQGAETIHAKFILRDHLGKSALLKATCMVMTYNLDWRSEVLNLETAVEFKSRALCDDLQTWLKQHRQQFALVAANGRVLKKSTLPVNPSDLVKRFIIQAIEKQL